MGNLLPKDWADWVATGGAAVVTSPLHSKPNAGKLFASNDGTPVDSQFESPVVNAGPGAHPFTIYLNAENAPAWLDLRVTYPVGLSVQLSSFGSPPGWFPLSFSMEQGPGPGTIKLGTVRGVGSGSGSWYVDSPHYGDIPTVMAEAFTTWAENNGHGTKAVDLFAAIQPDTPDDCIAAFDESAPAWRESQGLAIDRFGLQLLVRRGGANGYAAARDKAIEIHHDISGFSGELASGEPHVIMVEAVTAPSALPSDYKDRAVWVSHYIFTVQSTGDAVRQ